MPDEFEPQQGDDHGATEDSDAQGYEQSSLPADVLVEAFARARRIASFDASNVPGWLMAEPIDVALEWLEEHGRHCKHPSQCADTPRPLRHLLKMRRSARGQHRQGVHAALWRHRSSGMTEAVRSVVATEHEELLDAIETGQLFDPDSLGSRLGELDEANGRDLAAALWAGGLEDPRASELFSLLPALVPGARDEAPPSVALTGATPVSAPVEKSRHRDKRLALERQVAELQAELTGSRADKRSRAEELSRVRRKLDDSTRELEGAARRYETLEGELKSSTDGKRAAEARLREAERSWKQASAASEAYRVDLERAQSELANAEAERSALVRNLASTSARVQDLQGQLGAVPRDKDAIDDWLRREEERLNEMVYTLEGGARERVMGDKRLRRKLELAFLEAYPEFKEPRPSPVGGTRSLTFRALGGGDEVGRSAYLFSIGSHDILVDCGIAVGARHREEQTPDLSGVRRLDALLVTHAHTDHVGWIPALVASLADPFPIYCTRPTAELLPVMLWDSRGHYERALAEEQVKRRFDPSAPEVLEAYTRDDIVDAETRLLEARVGETEGIGGTDLRATFFPAGHILGAASILLEGGGRRVVISGDISSQPQHTVGSFTVPEGLGDVDLLVLEATYGDRVRESARVAEGQLVQFVAETVSRGIALLPCFALGRAQEVLAILLSARRNDRLPANMKILTDGMINKINPVYADQAKLDLADFVEIGSSLDREFALRDAMGPEPVPTVVVTTSGMLTGGPVIEWARRLLPDGRHRMALLGYQDEGAPGGLVRRLARERAPYSVTLRDQDGEPVEVSVASSVAEVGLSAHADQDGLVAYASAVAPKRIALVHGDDGARSALRDRLIREEVCRDVELAQVVHVP